MRLSGPLRRTGLLRNAAVREEAAAVHWWVWLLLAWSALSAVGALVLGAVAARARLRERALRRRQYEAESQPVR